MTEPAGGRPAREWAPAELGVQPTTGGGPQPAYIRRPHDELLRRMLDPDVPDSRLVLIRGESATGKTRAAYEAVVDRLADWSLEYPRTADALAARLEAGIPARTVLWLGEFRHYADADGSPAVLSRLDDLLEGEGHLIITTMWPEHWELYAAAAHGGTGAGDPAGVAGRLLDHLEELAQYGPDVDVAYGGILDVPARFTAAEMTAAAAAGDPVLAAAAAYGAGRDGRVTQYLAGVPELLDRYAGPGGDPHGQAIITAAMDAARLGHADPLPAELVREAAVGYLAREAAVSGPSQEAAVSDLPGRRPAIGPEGGWDGALAWATDELEGAVPTLRPVPARAGTGVSGYRVAGYLDQHGRRTRADQLGPASLWDAVVTHATSAGDLTRLGQAARDRGLYRHAAILWTSAAGLGRTDAAQQLITHLHRVSAADAERAARWAVGRADLEDPWEVARLLEALREAGAAEAIRALLARDPARLVRLDHRWDLGRLLAALHAAGADGAIRTLAARAADQASLEEPQYVAWLLRALHAAGARDAVSLLATRAAAEADLEDMSEVAALLGAMHAAGADDAVRSLATRAAGEVDVQEPQGVANLLRALRAAGAGEAVATLLARDPAARASADSSWESAELLEALHAAGAEDAVRTMAARAAEQASLEYPESTARLLSELRRAGADDAVRTLLARDPAGQADLHFAYDLTLLLSALAEAGADDAVRDLAARAAEQAIPYDPSGVVPLLEAMHALGADEAVRVLAARAVDEAGLGPEDVAGLLEALVAVEADDAVQAYLALDPAGQAGLDDPWDVALLLAALHKAGAREAERTLAAGAAGQVSLDDPQGVARLLTELRAAGAGQAADILATRAAGQIGLDDPQGVARLLTELRAAEAGEAADTLLARDPAGQVAVGFDQPFRPIRQRDVTRLLAALREAGADEAVGVLATRAADAGMFGLFLEVHPDEAASYRFGREPDGVPSRAWTWHEPASQPASRPHRAEQQVIDDAAPPEQTDLPQQ
ncbi:MAG TPA: hypothetical protein VEF71_11380 [Streptosporangiaceae bacterium]|nr:hypothetical protein [Streptosporangiaceae bacterium]